VDQLAFSGSYFLNSSSQGACQVVLFEDSLRIKPQTGEALFYSLRDVLDFTAQNYKVELSLGPKEKLTLSDLGYHFEDFLRNLSRLRNEQLLKDMLMNEKVELSGVPAVFNGGGVELRVYQTALVILPEKAELLRIPLGDIQEIKVREYQVFIKTEEGRDLIFSQMGKWLDPFEKALREAIMELSLRTQAWLKEIIPQAEPGLIRELADRLKEGRAVKKSEIQKISADFWASLEKRIRSGKTKDTYDYLMSLSDKSDIFLGIKRGLAGGQDYLWFFIPVPKKNALAMETFVWGEGMEQGEEGSGQATYFFRLVSRKDFRGAEGVGGAIAELIPRLNRALLMINFRREPIYLPDDKLEDPQYQKYKFSIAKIPGLKELRSAFIGRVIHAELEQWKKDVIELLDFNVKAKNDAERWIKEEAPCQDINSPAGTAAS